MIAPARTAAFDILRKIENRAGHSDELLRGAAVDALSPLDRNLATNLVMGALRWQRLLDARVAAFISHPENKLPISVTIALRLGAFQLLFLDRIPAHAAIGESVELAKQAENRFIAGMVNAILRKVAATPRPDSLSSDAALLAHPLWQVERWRRFYGPDAAAAICRFDQQPAPVSIRVADDAAEEALLRGGIELAPGEFLTRARRVLRGDVTATEAYRCGRVRIQDEGSQLVAELAGHGERILDVCAAPGGKTAVLAERNSNAAIKAIDASERRLSAMRRLLRDMPGGECIRYEAADVTKQNLQPEFDLILCDVPCSGTGTMARNPEIRHRIAPEELPRQQARQVAILNASLAGLAPGGRLLYSTCSLEPEENEAVIEACLRSKNDYSVAPLEPELDILVQEKAISQQTAASLRNHALLNGNLRTLPGVQACDGFFAALVVRSR